MSMTPTITGSVLIVIPCRTESSRLPNKPLLVAGDKPLYQWTYERAKQTGFEVVVTTNDQKVLEGCHKRSIPYYISDDHPTGTSRCQEVSEYHVSDFVVNWQVDEPDFPPQALISALALYQTMGDDEILSFSCPLESIDYCNRNIVKVWENIYSASRFVFSRKYLHRRPLAHIGIYAFKRNSLLNIHNQENPPEGLEQLLFDRRFILHPIPTMPQSINSQSDWDEFKKRKESQ